MSLEPLQALPETAPEERPQFFNPSRSRNTSDSERGERHDDQDYQPRWWGFRESEKVDSPVRIRKPR